MSGLDFRDGVNIVTNASNMYSTDLFTDKAVEIIERHAKYKRKPQKDDPNVDEVEPLFLEIAHQAVHSGNSISPLEAPAEYVNRVSHIQPYERRMFAAMMTALDDSVARVVSALRGQDLLKV